MVKVSKLFLYIGLIMLLSNAKAQNLRQAVNSAGGSTQSSSYQLQYAIGEVRVGAISTSNNTLDEGILLRDILESLSLNVEEKNISKVTVYPNPAVAQISILTNTTNFCNAIIYDMQGRKVGDKSIENNTLNISDLVTGRYQLLLLDAEGTLKSTSTLIKTNF